MQDYQPEIWSVKKDVIYASIPAVEAGLEYARELLSAHDSALGRTTRKNKCWAETIEQDIRHMERTLEMLRACGQNDLIALVYAAVGKYHGSLDRAFEGWISPTHAEVLASEIEKILGMPYNRREPQINP